MSNSVLEDEKLQQYLTCFEEGMTRDEIATKFDVQWKSIDMYFRRRGYKWDSELNTYVVREVEVESEPTIPLNTKAAQVVRLLDVKYPNIRQTANKMGFESVELMGEYMKLQGYIWDDDANNYVFRKKDIQSFPTIKPLSSSSDNLDEWSFIQLLLQHKDRLLDLLSAQQSLTTYGFRGNKVNKTLTLTSGCVTLLEDYSKEFNITQRQIVETALAEFFERHGYSSQLQQVIN